MYRKITALGLALIFVLSSATIGLADNKARSRKAPVNALASLMPASDAIVTFDSDRFLTEALPQILASNQPLYDDINAKIDQMRKASGVDLRQVDQLAMSLTVRAASKGQVDFDPLLLARGKFNSDGIVAIVGLASEGKYRQDTIAGHTVYIFSPVKVDPNSVPKTNDAISQVLDMLLVGLDREMALTAYDDKTLAVGATERVRDLLEKKTRVSEEMLVSVSQNSKAILGIAAKMPTGLNQFIDLGSDSLGKTLSGIRFLNGSMDMTETNATLALSARMDTVEQAVTMKDLLVGFQGLFGGLMSGGKGKDKDIFARMIKNAQISRVGSQVKLDVAVPQSDIAQLVAAKK